jgi:hypothetical protein
MEKTVMDHALRNKFNDEVERYRRALIHYAKACEWEMFENKASILFDYLEAIERHVIERRFFMTFYVILAMLIAAVVAIVKMDAAVFPVFLKYKNALVLTAIAVSIFELYFYIDFRMYVHAKMSWYKKRKEQFIKNIERDFKEIIIPSMEKDTGGLTIISPNQEREIAEGRRAPV